MKKKLLFVLALVAKIKLRVCSSTRNYFLSKITSRIWLKNLRALLSVVWASTAKFKFKHFAPKLETEFLTCFQKSSLNFSYPFPTCVLCFIRELSTLKMDLSLRKSIMASKRFKTEYSTPLTCHDAFSFTTSTRHLVQKGEVKKKKLG